MCSGAEIMLAAGAVQGVGSIMQGRDTAKQLKARAGQVATSAIETMKQKSIAQSRKMGEQRAAYGKSGVTLKGSPTVLLEEQARQDELELLKDKYNAELSVKDDYRRASAVQKEALIKGVSGFASGFGNYIKYS